MRAPAKKNRRKTASPAIFVRLSDHIALEPQADENLAACFDGYLVGLGKFSAAAADRARKLSAGMTLDSFAGDGAVDKEIDLLVRRLARRGLVEYRLAHPHDTKTDRVVIEPQVVDYWPRMTELDNDDTIVLSRFAYLRRRGNDMVLESPRAGALFRICDPRIAAALAGLSIPQKLGKFRRRDDFPGSELLALLLDCQIVFSIDVESGGGLRVNEGDDNLVLWDFHDLLFHTRSTEGRQANPLGGLHPYAGSIAPLPAVRPRWPGKKIDLRKLTAASLEPALAMAKLLRARHSTRDFDDRKPITLAELERFLDGTARVLSKWKSKADFDGGPVISYTRRPYPSGGSAYELELYLAVANCEGLARGFYHYDAGAHALVAIDVHKLQLEALSTAAGLAMDAPAPPQILITIAARFGRVSWKYSSIAYSLILKDVGGLFQTFYLMATEMGLGGCAVGTGNIDTFARMTGLEFHVEGPVGQFALGRAKDPGAPG